MQQLFRRHVALPADHGSWVFLLSPLLIGLFAGGRWSTPSLYLILAALSAFLVRQPITLVVKAHSGRRSPDVLPAAWFWIAVYSVVGLLHVAGLAVRGFDYVLYLAIPGVPVFAWHLYLVARRAERRQLPVEVAATGVLALAAPAGLWIGLGWPAPVGWLLWILAWTQSVASIAHALMRLEQRVLREVPGWGKRWRMARFPLVLTSANVLGVLALGSTGGAPRWLFVPYALQWVEGLLGVARPAVGFKPVAIGVRQLIVSAVFTALFIVAWSL